MRPFESLRRDPVLLTLIGITLVGCGLFFVFAGDSSLQTQIYWATQVPLDAALALGGWRLRGLAHTRYRRFWSMIGFAGASFTLGDSYQFLHTVLAPGIPSMSGGMVQTVFFAVGMTSNVIACLIFPQGLRTRRERFVFWLDATTVLVGGGVVAWCFAFNPISSVHVDRTNASVTAALVLVATFSATKVALIRNPPMARIAAWPMVSAAMIQGVSTFLPGDFQSTEHAYVFVIRLLPSVCIAVGPWIQVVLLRIGAVQDEPKRRPYSLLPYGMIAVTFVVFFMMLPDTATSQLVGATAGVVVITCLVAGRQLVAFHDNMQLIERLDQANAVDGLTLLANRTHFTEEIPRLLTRQSSMLHIDLDDFKEINDTMGHAAGDTLLIEVADRLRAAVRPGDLISRQGGDEFAILLPGAGPDDAALIADEILRQLAVPLDVRQHTVVTRASIGIAPALPGDEASALLSMADIAMYEAKRRGKSMWVHYTDDMGARVSAEAVLIREMSQAIENNEFMLVYQPIVRLADERLTGVESLIRWNHPTRGLVSPVEFIPLAERTGQIVTIGLWALGEACRQGAAWRREHPEAQNMSVGVNVAGRQLRTPGFVADVAAVLATTGLPAGNLTIEVTETAVLDDEESHEAMVGLRALGVKLALDDFGTAASSLGLLLTCPVTSLKLDRSFVESITTVGRQSAVATAVSQMASALDFASVAEGIETVEQRDLIKKLGYQYGQGYLYSKPVAPELIVEQWAAARV
ncbi:diguanylate cyclase (GGDEF)-like protein [Actinoplanes lutulentus]|uniref:Diguanylate cyclase (GGDEF)-like protein n=1 Tax=Actinoplanes lutulentus TaxID=1287878 RepID=A0A327ZAI0_9ACTN|nr:EAL domain-containing protein [Actinoplanes lutulentus]MBB2948546.1 diguanylate cyclase (GGDEF)-like protein [Actinoplanes lutulentus]RAK34422.1 diguanylate cyclase (GGDEF)-like protein [Actinoplanes lutulentus]